MWQYKQVVVPINATIERRQQALDEMGRDGWELKTVHSQVGSRNEVLVFARQVTQEAADPKPAGPRPLNG